MQNQPAVIPFMTVDGADLYWAEQRPAEAGRTTILRLRGGNVSEVIPKGSAIGSKIHGGYGGAPFCVHKGMIYFIGKTDQRIYQSDDPFAALPITPAGLGSFSGLSFDAHRNRLLGVLETEHSGKELNRIVAISILTGSITELYAGSDFVGEPHISPDGKEVAFLTWDLPEMQWERSCVKVGRFGADGLVEQVTALPCGKYESHAQPLWSPNGQLLYSSDRAGYWNIYLRGKDDPLHRFSGDSSLPLWSLGVSQYAFRNDSKLVVSYQVRGSTELWELDLETGSARRIETEFTSITQLRGAEGQVFGVGASAISSPKVIAIARDAASELYVTANQIKSEYLAAPRELALRARDGGEIFGWYYPPKNPGHRSPENPPVIVMIHGGPTNCAVPELALRKLYFTSRGFAVLDLNYRGSSGFGRAYRERLNGKWMVADVEDCIDAASELTKQGISDGPRFIRGTSAGGATALLSLAKSKVFSGAAIYYPVVNLNSLLDHSPKFEAGYVVGLVGPITNAPLYIERSPITHVDSVAVTPIFFHGLEDRVCKPAATIAYVEALKTRGLNPELNLYPSEGHSFRSGEVLSDSLDKELRYYQGILAGGSR